jgi:hypothetical protein
MGGILRGDVGGQSGGPNPLEGAQHRRIRRHQPKGGQMAMEHVGTKDPLLMRKSF